MEVILDQIKLSFGFGKNQKKRQNHIKKEKRKFPGF
jgi:hypothetical protein